MSDTPPCGRDPRHGSMMKLKSDDLKRNAHWNEIVIRNSFSMLFLCYLKILNCEKGWNSKDWTVEDFYKFVVLSRSAGQILSHRSRLTQTWEIDVLTAADKVLPVIGIAHRQHGPLMSLRRIDDFIFSSLTRADWKRSYFSLMYTIYCTYE